MGDMSSIGGGEGVKPTGSPGSGSVGDPSGGSIENAMHTPVKTLGDLKRVLIDNLGEKQGTKLYNNFMSTFCMQILSQVQESAQQAKKAAQQMRQGPDT